MYSADIELGKYDVQMYIELEKLLTLKLSGVHSGESTGVLTNRKANQADKIIVTFSQFVQLAP